MTTSFTVVLAKDGPLLSRVEDLMPTQARVGYQEVDRKAQKIREMTKSERHEYLRENPVPVVIGPGGLLYVVDHHHLARAVYEAGHSKIYVSILDDYSKLSDFSFWNLMRKKNWVYLLDDVEKKTLKSIELPKTIKDMKDDPFRSLAGMLRRARGFIKSETDYFIEFKWSVKLREHFEKQKYLIRSEWREKDLNRAMQFALSDEARTLPGSISKIKCEKLF